MPPIGRIAVLDTVAQDLAKNAGAETRLSVISTAGLTVDAGDVQAVYANLRQLTNAEGRLLTREEQQMEKKKRKLKQEMAIRNASGSSAQTPAPDSTAADDKVPMTKVLPNDQEREEFKAVVNK